MQNERNNIQVLFLLSVQKNLKVEGFYNVFVATKDTILTISRRQADSIFAVARIRIIDCCESIAAATTLLLPKAPFLGAGMHTNACAHPLT